MSASTSLAAGWLTESRCLEGRRGGQEGRRASEEEGKDAGAHVDLDLIERAGTGKEG